MLCILVLYTWAFARLENVMLVLNFVIQLQVGRVDFSDPQGGKGACDRKAATIKAHVRRYIAEGHNVQSAVDLQAAILSHGCVPGVRVCCIDTSTLTSTAIRATAKIDAITLLNNFHLDEKELTVWRAYNTGGGKSYTWSHLQGITLLFVRSFFHC